MKFNIYNFNNEATEVDTGDKEIQRLYVQVLTWDEVVTVEYNDGTRETFDSSNNRFVDFVEGFYIVEQNCLQDWINYVPTDYDKQPWYVHYTNNTGNIPNKRMCEFYELVDEERCKFYELIDKKMSAMMSNEYDEKFNRLLNEVKEKAVYRKRFNSYDVVTKINGHLRHFRHMLGDDVTEDNIHYALTLDIVHYIKDFINTDIEILEAGIVTTQEVQ